MSKSNVTIKVIGSPETNEYKDALALQSIFEESLIKQKNASGKILILSGVTLFGQPVKDIDLVVIGDLKNYSLEVNTKFRYQISGTDEWKTSSERKVQRVNFYTFCFVIESKRHSEDRIIRHGQTLKVKYKSGYKDATDQSEKQGYSLKNFFEERLGYSPWITNLIWLKNISSGTIKGWFKDTVDYDSHNYLPSQFKIKYLFQLACLNQVPWKNGNGNVSFNAYSKDTFPKEKDLIGAFDLFEKVKKSMGEITRSKLAKITKQLLSNQVYANQIGEKLTIISGRAGTGKTIKLLNIAFDLALYRNKRCLILTYNKALVSDIKRCLALAEMPDDVDEYEVQVSTLDKFFYEILLGFKLLQKSEDYPKVKEERLVSLLEFLEEKVIGEMEIQELMDNRYEQVGWDHILIDEGQDWKEIERQLILKIFGYQNLIVADGVDQLVRSQNKCNWQRGLNPSKQVNKTHEKKGLRQKVNLLEFINLISKKNNLRWSVDPKPELIGGKVIVTNKYSKELHDEEFAKCKTDGNEAYDMLFLVPPSMVEKTYNGNREDRKFKFTQQFERMGVKVWDGTSAIERSVYPTDIDQFRLLQYESCRGLEGWTVVCLELDEFLKYKFETYDEVETGEIAYESPEVIKRRFIYLWLLIPLTRAIDTLIITLKDVNSELGRELLELCEQHDFIEYVKN